MSRFAMVLQRLSGAALGAVLAVAGWHGVTRWEARYRPASLLAAAPLPGPGAGPVVGFLFSAEMCAGRLRVIDSLNALHHRGVAVVGWLTVDRYRFPGWRDLVAAARIDFPVVPVSPARARRAMLALGQGAPLLLVFRQGRLAWSSESPEDPPSLAFLTGLAPPRGTPAP